MTIIVYRDGILATDSSCGHWVKQGTVQKAMSTNGWLYGAAGESSSIAGFHIWMKENSNTDFFHSKDKPSLAEDFAALVISPDGSIYLCDNRLYPRQIEAEFYTLGCADDIATGALGFGATAIEAVDIAIKYANTCHGPIQYVELKTSADLFIE